MQRKISALLFSMLLLGGVVASLSAQETPGFGDVVDVKVVNLEVVVEDRDGVRVTGLAPEDLRLIIDGQETEIAFFTEVLGGRAVAARDGALPGAPAAVSGETVENRYLVFIDEYFTIGRDRDRVVKAVIDGLGELRPSDSMAVVAFNGRRVEMLSSWTSSQRRLEEALRGALERPTFGLQRLGERRAFGVDPARGLGRSPVRFGGTRLSIAERAYAGQISGQLERTVDAAVATLRGFGRPSGRKVMMLLSGGWPLSPAEFAADDLLRPLSAYDGYSGRHIYGPLVDTANRLGFTLYPVDVAGLEGGFGADVSFAGRQDSRSTRRSFERERIVHDAFQYLANETGGRALINGQRLQAVNRVVEDTRSYYWIGFVPKNVGDNLAYEVEIKTLKPGLKVRTRRSYRDLSRTAEVSMEVESALLFGDAPAAEGLVVDVGVPEPAGRRRIELPLSLQIPVAAITPLPEADGPVAYLELRIAALDDKDRRSDVSAIPIEVRFDEAPRDNGLVAWETKVLLRKQPQDLVVAVHDPASGRGYMTRLAVAP
ncbi:MAG: VWA domain-containing protein [Acidobacteriota bacterium]